MPSRPEEDRGDVARRRYQNPKPHQHGEQWRVLVWKDVYEDGKWTRRRVAEVLGSVHEMGFRQAQKLVGKVTEPLNKQPRNPGVAITFKEFAEQIYIKLELPLYSKSHELRYAGILKNYLLPAIGHRSLFDLEQPTSTLAQQVFTDLKDKGLAKESLDKIRDCFSSVMNSALEKRYITNNPSDNLKMPKGRPTPKLKPTITVREFELLVEAIPEPYATMVYVAVYTGLRFSELAGLRWRCLHEAAITIEEKYCRGEWGEPKSDASRATIKVLPKVIARIHALKQMKVRIGGGRGKYQTFKLVKSSRPEDLVFQSVRKGAPMRDNNILSRFIIPAAEKLKLGTVNWQCLRRSHATWMKRAGIPLADASHQMRHSRVSTTADIYEMTPEQDQLEAISKLESFTSKAVQ